VFCKRLRGYSIKKRIASESLYEKKKKLAAVLGHHSMSVERGEIRFMKYQKAII
jgi:hypothetical protein